MSSVNVAYLNEDDMKRDYKLTAIVRRTFNPGRGMNSGHEHKHSSCHVAFAALRILRNERCLHS